MKIEFYYLDEKSIFLEDYIKLRNKYSSNILSGDVTLANTIKWIKETNNYIRLAINNNKLVGVCILYTNKSNEITIFTKYPNRGIGSLLLNDIENIARKNNILRIWSWIENGNESSKKLFKKLNFFKKEEKTKFFININKHGAIFQKILKENI